MLLSGTILTCLLMLLPAVNSFYGALTDSPFFGFDSFADSDLSSIIRKSRFREYESSPPSYYTTSGYYHNGPSYGPPPSSYHSHPPTYTYDAPPPFAKHSYRNPHHYHSRPPGPPSHDFDSSEHNSYGSWGSQEYDDSIYEPSPHPKTKGKVSNCHSSSRRPSYATSTRPMNTASSGSQAAFPPFLNQRPKTPAFPPFMHPNFHSVTTTSSGTTISAPSGLVSGNINQNNFPQSTLQSSQENGFDNSRPPPSQPTDRPTTDVSSLLAGVFPGTGTQSAVQPTPNSPSTPGRDDNGLIAGVFPSLSSQGNQPQQFNRPTAPGGNTGNLFAGMFSSPATSNSRPPIQNIPSAPGTIGDLIAGVFENPIVQSPQPPQQNNPTPIGSDVDSLVAGVFSSQAQGQQNNNVANTSPTGPSNSNVLISGTVSQLPQFGERIPAPSVTSSPFRPTQNNGDKIPVFQYNFPSPSIHQQIFTPTTTSSSTNTSQNIPVFQPPQETVAPDSTTDAANGDNGTQNGDEEDTTALDIDIRLGQIGVEINPSENQRKRAKAA